ncbi:hypothetical protein V5G94_24700, partial [Citrobacter braakii]
GMTVRELVAIGRYPWHGALGRFGVADREKVEEAISLVGLKPLGRRTSGRCNRNLPFLISFWARFACPFYKLAAMQENRSHPDT